MTEKLIIIGGSAGSYKIVNRLLSTLQADFPYPVIICMHRLRNARTGFVEALALTSKMKVSEASDKDYIRKATAYVAPANYHMMIEFGYRFSLSVSAPVNHSRPSIDITMETAAEVFRERAVGIILSGANMDGSRGMAKIHEMKGTTVVQDPDDCEIKTMPEATLHALTPDYVLKAEKIITFIQNLRS